MGHAGMELMLLLVMAAAFTQSRRRRVKKHHLWRRRFVLAGFLLLIGCAALPFGVSIIADNSIVNTVELMPPLQPFTPPAFTPPAPVVVQSNPPLPVPGDPTWNQYQTELAQPKNDAGVTPHRPHEAANGSTIVNLASQNFSFTAPILQLSGRGVGVALAAVYNSRTWSETGSFMNWNADDGFPSPGWRLDFGSIGPAFVDQTSGKNAYLLIQPDGSRRLLLEITGQSGQFQTVDSSFLKFDSATRILKTPNGQQIQYQQVTLGSTYRFVPTQIKDVNGNFITVQYVAGTTRIGQITDTLGRLVTFEYDPVTSRLLRIKAPDFADSTASNPSIIRTVAEFQYTTLTHNFTFSGSWTVRGASGGSSLTALNKIVYPTTGAAISFDYRVYGVIRKITRLDPTGATISYSF
jgi:hypothetical protein